MKTVASISAGIALITSIVSVNLWQELRAEKQVNAELRTRVAVPLVVNRAPEVPAPVAADVAPPVVAVAAKDVPVCKSESPAPKAAPGSIASSLENSQNLQRELMKDPEYRKLRLAQARANMERNYPGLAEELGLSEKEADRLFNLLAEQQTAQSAESSILSLNTQDPAAMQEYTRRQQAIQSEQNEAIKSMLGSKYTQWQDYQQTRPARTRVMSLNSQLAQAGVPLTDTQTRSLTTTMIAEQQRQTQEARVMQRTPINPADPDARTKMLEEQMKRMEDNNRRMVDVAAPHLTAKQLSAYREQVEQQAAIQRISMKMQIEQQRLQPQTQP